MHRCAVYAGGWELHAGAMRCRRHCLLLLLLLWLVLSLADLQSTFQPNERPQSACIDSTCRTGIEKHGGRVLLRSHVEQVLVEGGRAAGVRLRGSGGGSGRPEVVRARRAVVTNASVWDTMRLLPEGRLRLHWSVLGKLMHCMGRW